MDWLLSLFNKEEEDLSKLTDKTQFKNTSEFQNATLRKIHNAKIRSENDALNFAKLVASYLGKELPPQGTPEFETIAQSVIELTNMVIKPLQDKKSSLEKNSPESKEFRSKANPNWVISYLVLTAWIAKKAQANQEKPTELSIAMVRPLVKFEYKIREGKLKGKIEGMSPVDLISKLYHIEPAYESLVRKEINRAYIPSYISYGVIAVSFITIGTIVYKKWGKK